MKEAGIKAGYSLSYCEGDIYKKFESERFLTKLRKQYNGNAHALLPKILRAESKVVDLILEDPTTLPKYRHTLKEIKQTAGLLQPDDAPKAPVIKIGNVKNLLLNAHEGWWIPQ